LRISAKEWMLSPPERIIENMAPDWLANTKVGSPLIRV
jgi:hypothetical protein